MATGSSHLPRYTQGISVAPEFGLKSLLQYFLFHRQTDEKVLRHLEMIVLEPKLELFLKP